MLRWRKWLVGLSFLVIVIVGGLLAGLYGKPPSPGETGKLTENDAVVRLIHTRSSVATTLNATVDQWRVRHGLQATEP
jgi:hypothetical protein